MNQNSMLFKRLIVTLSVALIFGCAKKADPPAAAPSAPTAAPAKPAVTAQNTTPEQKNAASGGAHAVKKADGSSTPSNSEANSADASPQPEAPKSDLTPQQERLKKLISDVGTVSSMGMSLKVTAHDAVQIVKAADLSNRSISDIVQIVDRVRHDDLGKCVDDSNIADIVEVAAVTDKDADAIVADVNNLCKTHHEINALNAPEVIRISAINTENLAAATTAVDKNFGFFHNLIGTKLAFMDRENVVELVKLSALTGKSTDEIKADAKAIYGGILGHFNRTVVHDDVIEILKTAYLSGKAPAEIKALVKQLHDAHRKEGMTALAASEIVKVAVLTGEKLEDVLTQTVATAAVFQPQDKHAFAEAAELVKLSYSTTNKALSKLAKYDHLSIDRAVEKSAAVAETAE